MSMSTKKKRQKEVERQILEAARHTCSLFPPGDIQASEEPDLWIKTGTGSVWVEVTELVRPKGDDVFPPVEKESFHQDVVRLAEAYHRASEAAPAGISVYFSDEQRCRREDPDGWNRLTSDKKAGGKREKMARSLAEFVKDQYVPEAETVTFSQRINLPTGFSVIRISSSPGSWHSGESGCPSSLDHEQLASTIKKKNDLLPKYRANAPNSPIWLLIASGASVSRGVPIPTRSIDEWKFPFDFDKVLLFSVMDNRVFEIGRV